MFSLMIRSLIASASLVLGIFALPPAPREVEIVGLDYAFTAPSELPAGRTTFRFVNKGRVRHELNIVLLAPGVTVPQFIAATNADSTSSSTLSAMVEATVGVLFAEPGKRASAALSTELLPGRTYSVRCVLRDSTTKPRHQMLGMYAGIHVANGTSAASPTVHADTIVANDYAFRYPQTLTPGIHDIAFVNEGKQRHEMVVGLLKRRTEPQAVFDAVRAGRFRRSLLEDSFGVLHTRGGTSPQGVLRIQLLPGRDYLLVCTFADSNTAPPHFMLGMFGNIHVSGASAEP